MAEDRTSARSIETLQQPKEKETDPCPSLWVVVPLRNEAAGIRPTLAALAAQRDRDFTLVLVDNGSTDGSADVIRRALAMSPILRWRLIDEPQKGTGAAADTGFRFAIASGATHIARTDADCLPDPGWITAIRAGFASGAELIAGKIGPRLDEEPLRFGEATLLRSRRRGRRMVRTCATGQSRSQVSHGLCHDGGQQSRDHRRSLPQMWRFPTFLNRRDA